jgi:hypothetical protein
LLGPENNKVLIMIALVNNTSSGPKIRDGFKVTEGSMSGRVQTEDEKVREDEAVSGNLEAISIQVPPLLLISNPQVRRLQTEKLVTIEETSQQ